MPAPPFYPVMTTPEQRDEVCEVLPRKLYLTNWRGAEDKAQLKAKGVTHVAAVGSEFMCDEEVFVYWKKDIHDDDEMRDEMAKSMVEGAAFCAKAIKGGGCVLVHCAAGMSRSVTVVLAYLLLHCKKTLREAFALVHAARPGIWPNDGFMLALIEKEASLGSGKSTIQLDEYIAWGDYDDAGEDPQAPEALPRLMRGETTVSPEEREHYRTERADSAADIGVSEAELAVKRLSLRTDSSGSTIAEGETPTRVPRGRCARPHGCANRPSKHPHEHPPLARPTRLCAPRGSFAAAAAAYRMGSVTREDRIALKAEAERGAIQARTSLGRTPRKIS